eukprot:CAMPEP_0116104516 /NCGR_PEP_ID=MMETSP0327-20121206/14498_1 /TAXON_ID=44447 /ORGANISM="Pseudo-nitzschia delicatissima, Strain B596" /LENGTH=425 /DNA_ID=CAMNT_0003596775 /DNA_START=120 /DNA_END=1397 /DNA_ORIENTATION=+
MTPPITDPSSTPSPRSPHEKAMLYISPYTIFLATIVVVLVLTRIIQICQIRRIRRRQQREAEARWNANMNGILSGSNLLYNGVTINLPRGVAGEYRSVPISLDAEDRIKLYKRAFQRSNLNHTLTKQDFQEPNASDDNNNNDENDDNEDNEDNDDNTNNNTNDNTNNKNNNRDVESQEYNYYYDEDDDDDETPSLYLDLNKNTTTAIPNTSLAVTTKTNVDNDASQKQQKQQEKSLATTTTTTTTTTTNQNDTENDSSINTPRTKIQGTCIVCFENFKIGDTIVKSENTDACQHVFHEDCMVRFLASNSERTKPYNNNNNNNNDNNNNNNNNTTSYSDNPCPTCRHPFCTVAQDEIVLAVLLKSMRFALVQNRENNNNQNNSIENNVENPVLDVANADVTLRISNDDESHSRESVDEEEGQNTSL